MQLGIIVGLISTSVQSLGLTLQRKSHILEDEKGPHDTRRPPHRRRRWQIGMAMFVAANIFGSTVQISTLPLPVLSTLQASGLVFNSACATLILSEPFTRWSLWGTVLVCVGAVLIAVFGAIPAPAHTLQELLALLWRRSFVIWMSLQALLVICIAVVTDAINYFSTVSQSAKFRLVRGLAYGCISGILSAHSLLVAKTAVELIIKTISDGTNQFVHWQSWMLVLTLVGLALSQLYYLHRGLKLVSTSILYPLCFCIYNIIAILDGLIYFRQTDLIKPLHACLVATGTVVLLSGVLALSWRLSDEQHTPGVGQSSLAPGLGLVEDTEGEEESLLGGGSPSGRYRDGEDGGRDDETNLDLERNSRHIQRGNRNPASFSYHSFDSPRRTGGEESMTLKPKRGLRSSERAQIWGELDDEPEPNSPSMARRRSTSHLAPDEHTSLLHSGRTASAGSPSNGVGSIAGNSATGNMLRDSSIDSFGSNNGKRPARRRRSTGFPGFTARRHSNRQREDQRQGAMGGIWRFGWWRSRSSSLTARQDQQVQASISPFTVDAVVYTDDTPLEFSEQGREAQKLNNIRQPGSGGTEAMEDSSVP